MKATRLTLLLLALLGTSLFADPPVGWRQDGTGRAGKANPPLEWSATKNVLWKAKLPASSFGTPVVVGERIFVVAEPAELLCLDAKEGEVAWKASSTYAEALGEEKAREVAEEDARLEKARDAARREEGKHRKEKPDDKEGLEKLRRQSRDAETALNEARRKYPKANGNEGAGRTAATPVSDGKVVACVFGTGVVSAFTVEGKRLWTKFVEAPQIGFGHSASPALAGDRLIVHLRGLIALDLKTGKEVWRVATPPAHASPVVVKVGKEQVVIAASGLVARAEDGKVLLKTSKAHSGESTPVVEGKVLYVSRSGGYEAFELSMSGEGALSMKSLWKAQGANGRRTPSSVVHDGLLYAVNTDGILDVVDAKEGEAVYRQRLGLPQVYSSLGVASGHVFAFDTRGKAVVFKAGRKYEAVATNQLEGTGASPVFVRDRLYVRGQKHLYCLKAKKDE